MDLASCLVCDRVLFRRVIGGQEVKWSMLDFLLLVLAPYLAEDEASCARDLRLAGW